MAPDLSRRVAITGAGAIGSFGVGTGALWGAAGAGDRTFASCTRYPGTLPCAEAVKPDLRRMLHTGQTSRTSLVSQFAIAAVHLALTQAHLSAGKGGAGPVIGIVYATSHGPAATTQEIYDDLLDHGAASVKPRAFQESVFNAPASLASIQFGLKGPIQVLAASVGAPVVLQQAQMLLSHPGVDAVIALCADELCEAVQSALRVLRWHRPAAGTEEPSSFSPRRGAVSSEGAAALLLERADDALARSVPALAEMAGAVTTNDAWKLVRPAPDARGLIAAVRGCFADAEAAPGDVDVILSALTNNDVDDALQAVAVRSVFGDTAPPVVSMTDDIGYAMGAAGMLDVTLAVEMVHRRRAPASMDSAGALAGAVGSILCTGVGLNGMFGAVLIREPAWMGAAPAFADQDARTAPIGRDPANPARVKGLAGRDVRAPAAVSKAAPGSPNRTVAAAESACTPEHRR